MKKKAGLGRLLLQGLSGGKRASPSSRPARRQRRPRKLKSDFTGFFHGLRTDQPQASPAPVVESPISFREEPEQVEPSLPIEKVQVQVPQLSPPEDRSGSDDGPKPLATAELIRPDDRLRQSIEGFLLDQRSPHTQRAYGRDLKRFVQFLIVRGINGKPERIDRSVLIAYKDSLLAEGLEHTTVDRHLATLRSFFRWLMDDGLIPKNPAEGVRFMNPKRISKTIGFSDEEVVKVLKGPNLHTRTGSMHYAILSVLFYCGLRRSEVCELRTTSLSEERGHAVLRLRGKGNAERIVVLKETVIKALKHYFRITGKDTRVDQPLFSPIRNNRGESLLKPLDSSMIFYIVTKYAKQAGVANRVSPHSCRATAISNARDHQVPDRAIQEFAGWASPDMITRYDKRRTSVEQSAAHAIQYGTEERSIPWVDTRDESTRQPPSSLPADRPLPEPEL